MPTEMLGELSVRLTGYRLLNTALSAAFIGIKAATGFEHNINTILPTVSDWVLGGVVALTMWWIGYFEQIRPPVAPWFFHADYLSGMKTWLAQMRGPRKIAENPAVPLRAEPQLPQHSVDAVIRPPSVGTGEPVVQPIDQTGVAEACIDDDALAQERQHQGADPDLPISPHEDVSVPAEPQKPEQPVVSADSTSHSEGHIDAGRQPHQISPLTGLSAQLPRPSRENGGQKGPQSFVAGQRNTWPTVDDLIQVRGRNPLGRTKYFMRLHNMMQASSGTIAFSTTDVATGPRHAEVWTSTILVQDVSTSIWTQSLPGTFFHASGRTKYEAREAAAYQVLQAMGVEVYQSLA